MRKVLSFVLVLSLVLGSFGMAFAATPVASDIAGKSCEDAVKVLTGLDVVSGYSDGTYRPDAIVTRAEMASLIVKGLGLNDYAVGTPKFADSQNHWAKGYIAYANSLGVISGRTATTFDPDATVTYDEAATMLVKAMGYSDDCLVGIWPTNYVTKAKVLGILDGVKSGTAGANRGDIAVMVYQTLDQAIGKVNKDGDWVGTATKFDASGRATEYDTMLARLGAKIYDVDGFYSSDDKNFIVKGDEDSIINLTPYKGALVSAYMNDDKEIIAIKEVFSSFLSGTISGDTLTIADGTEYTLKPAAQTEVAVASGTAVEFVNGDEKAFVQDLAGATVYTVAADVSGTKLNHIYSMNYWKVDAKDTLDADDVKDIAVNHKLLGVSFAENDKDEIDLESFELVGADSLDDIKADAVAYIYKNSDKEISRVAVGTTKVTGEVTKVNNGGTKVTIDGKTYKFASDELVNNGNPGEVLSKSIKAGDEVELILDAYGYIYDFEKASGKADKYGIVMNTGNSGGADSGAEVKLVLADGSNKIFNVDEEEVANDAIINSGSAVWNPTSPVTTGAIVKYGLDKNGVITSLKAASDSDLKFFSVNSSVTAKGYFDSKSIAKDAVLFNFVGTTFTSGAAMSSKTGDYETASYDKILDSDALDAYYVYDVKNKEIVAMLLNNATSSNDIYGVINSRGTNNSDAGAYYNMLVGGEEKPYNGTDSSGSNKYDAADTKALYLLKLDGNGDIKSFESWSTGAKDRMVASAAGVTSANAIAYNNRTVTISGASFGITGVNGASGNTGTTTASITLDRDVVVYVYDAADDEWRLGTTSDLRDIVDGADIAFYDLFDEDGIYDVVLLDELGDMI